MYNNESCSSYRNIKLADDSVIIRLLEGKELEKFSKVKRHDFFLEKGQQSHHQHLSRCRATNIWVFFLTTSLVLQRLQLEKVQLELGM